ncbi:MAG: NADH-quinone oxidoreductase subunit H, partial [Desulfobacterales bacterium]|nr:NADH-quinone oxidoreductase subunit H [Desulfobacterales bacterium]
NRTKAFFGGRNGAPLLQPYFDLWKLLHKGAVYSTTATWVFRLGPAVGLAAVLTALALTPLGNVPALVFFPGDLVLWIYALGLMRFLTVLAALDTGSAFEGMGASREVQFSVLAEVALMVGLIAVAVRTQSASLSALCQNAWTAGTPLESATVMLLVSAAFLIVFLTENTRIPVDDPNTHLELTMIHEVMILDHGGVDLAMIEYAAALKFWTTGSLLVSMALPLRFAGSLANLAAGFAGLLFLSVIVGVIESSMARLRLLRVPQILVTACVLSFLAVMVVVR